MVIVIICILVVLTIIFLAGMAILFGIEVLKQAWGKHSVFVDSLIDRFALSFVGGSMLSGGILLLLLLAVMLTGELTVSQSTPEKIELRK